MKTHPLLARLTGRPARIGVQCGFGLSLLVVRWLAASPVESGPPVGNVVPTPQSSVAAPTPTPAQIQRWVRDLGAPRLSVRAAAEDRLLENPVLSLKHFPERSTTFPPAQRDALRRLRGQLEVLVAQQESRASRVTIHGTFLWPDLLHQIFEQTGNRVVLSSEIDVAKRPAVRLSTDDAPFWDVLLNLARQEQLELRSTSAGIELVPKAGDHQSNHGSNLAEPADSHPVQNDATQPNEPPASRGWIDPRRYWVSNAFCLRLKSIETSSLAVSPGSSGEQPRELAKLRWSLMVEPRLKPLYLTIAAQNWQLSALEHPDPGRAETPFPATPTVQTEVTADQHSSGEEPRGITPFNPLAKYELGVDPQTGVVEWTQPFVGPPGWSQEDWELQGSGILSLAAGSARLVFDPLAIESNAVRRSGGVAVQVRGREFTAEPNGLWNVRLNLSVAYDTGGPVFESHRVGSLYQQARLIDGTNTRHRWLDLQPAQQGDGAALISYEFRSVPGPTDQFHFEYKAPTLFTDVEFRFAQPQGAPTKGE